MRALPINYDARFLCRYYITMDKKGQFFLYSSFISFLKYVLLLFNVSLKEADAPMGRVCVKAAVIYNTYPSF